jgi:hypothetical protein
LRNQDLIKPTVKPAVKDAVNGIPKEVVWPIWVLVSNEEPIDVRINVDESWSLSILTEIICCCWRYNNKPTIPPVMNIIILIIFFAKYPKTIPMKKPPTEDVIIGVKFFDFNGIPRKTLEQRPELLQTKEKMIWIGP